MAFLRIALISGLAWASLVLPVNADGPSLATVQTSQDVPGVREVIKSLQGSGISFVNPTTSPEFRSALAKVGALAQKLVLEKDGRDPIQLVFVNDMHVNSFFVQSAKPAGNVRILALNTGLLRFVKNDDELAQAIGHELERGTSQIEEVRKVLDQNPKEWLQSTLLKRAVENELDVKAVIGRVMQKGFNPQAAYEFQNRVIQEFGDRLSLNSTLPSARRDAIGLAVSYWTRELGRNNADRFGAQAMKTDTVSSLSFLQKDEFLKKRLAEAEAVIRKPSVSVASLYQKIAQGNFTDADSEKFRNAYKNAFEQNWLNIERHFAATLGEKERVELQMKLHRSLMEAFEADRARFIPPGFRAQTTAQLEALYSLDQRPVLIDGAKELITAREDLIKAEKELRAEQGRLKGERSPDLRPIREERVEEKAEKAGTARRTYERVKLAFQSGPDFDSRLDAYLASGKPRWSSIWTPGDLSRAGFTYREVDAPVQAGAVRTTELKRAHGDLFLAPGQELNSDKLGKNLGYFMAGHPDPREWGPMIDSYLNSLKTALRSASPGEKAEILNRQNLLYYRGRDDGQSIFALWQEYWKANPSDAKRKFETYIAVLEENIQDHASIYQLLNQYAKHAEPRFGSNVEEMRMNAELVSGDERIPTVFRQHPKMKEMLERKNEEFLRAALVQIKEGAEVDAGTLLSYYQANRWMILNKDDVGGGLSRPAIEELLQNSARALRSQVRNRLTPAQAEAAVFFRYPWLFEPKKHPELLARYAPVMEELSRSPDLTVLGKDWFNAGHIRKNLGPERPGEPYFELLHRLSPITEMKVSKNGPSLPTQEAYFQWLQAHFPENTAELYRVAKGTPSERMTSIYADYLKDRLQQAAAVKGWKVAVPEVLTDLSRAGAEVYMGGWGDGGRSLEKAILELAPADDVGKARFFLEYTNGVDAYLRQQKAAGATNWWDRKQSAWYPQGEFQSLFKSPERLAKLPSDLIADLINRVHEMGQSGSEWGLGTLDSLFEEFWKRAKDDPALRARLRDPKLVGALTFEKNRKTLALAQLAEFLPTKSAVPLSPTQERESLGQVIQTLSEQLPKPSALRNEIIDAVEKRIVSTRQESQSLNALRLKEQNWAQAELLSGMDSPTILVRNMRSQEDRLNLIRYFLGPESDPPLFRAFIRDDYGWKKEQQHHLYKKQLQNGKRAFLEASPAQKIYLLQPLLDENEGLLSKEKSIEDLFRYILGDTAENKHVKTLFKSYVNALPMGERKAVIAHLLASKAGKGAEVTSLKAILEAMGPFGIKAGQFLRTSGVLPRAERAQLENFLNQALPPNRNEIYEKLERIFGTSLLSAEQPVESVGRLVGSGSLNYVVQARIKNPETGKVEDVVVRILRDGAEGQIHNENQVWEKVLEELRKSPDPEILRMANLLDETRSHAWQTLQPGGIEFDLAHERKMYPKAREIYANPKPHPQTGFKMDVTEPLAAFQRLVDANPDPLVSRSVSIYRHVENQPLTAIENSELRAQLAQQILDAEMEGMFKKGRFDPDGHPGNWLVDVKNKTLVRTDYAQLKLDIPADDRKAFQRVMASLVRPEADSGMRRALSEGLSQVYSFSPGRPADLEEQILKVMKSPDFPSFTKPHERLIFLQENLEKHYLKAGPKGFEMRLRPNSGTMLAGLAKLQYYSEMMPAKNYAESILRALGVSKAEMGLLLAKQKFSQSVTSVIENCVLRFRMLGRQVAPR